MKNEIKKMKKKTMMKKKKEKKEKKVMIFFGSKNGFVIKRGRFLVGKYSTPHQEVLCPE